MKLFLRFIALTLGIVLSACASVTLPSSSTIIPQAETLMALKQWKLDGRLNIRHEGSSDIVALTWQQDDTQSSLRFSSSLLGLGAVIIQGNLEEAVIERAGEETVHFAGLEVLSSELLGYDFPVRHLLWWVRGLPSPNLETVKVSYANTGYITSLSQRNHADQQWQLTYSRFMELENDFVLPSRLELESKDLQLTLLIHRWQVGRD